jgi:uncharacterized FlaG/YvyC family protein
MISSISVNLDQAVQPVRKPDFVTSPVGVTGASSATAPQTSQAVHTVGSTEQVRDGDQHAAGAEANPDRPAREHSEENVRYEVSLDRDSGQRVFKRVVAATGHVLWQEPEEKLLDRAREQHKTTGLIADKTA